ncbi:hypothetical protein [Streptomyces sp. NPDC006012]|uniref:hypothetical protein n=1 Tax=Streptomyces sp. NPDC006012 TaxID=3364739 RepID=UPI0036AB6246
MQTREEFWEGISKGLDFYFGNPDNRGTIPPRSYEPDVDGTTIHNLGRNLQRYILAGKLPDDCPENVQAKVKQHNLLTQESKDIIATRRWKFPTYSRAIAQHPINSLGSDPSQPELPYTFPVNSVAPLVSTSTNLHPHGPLPGGKRTERKRGRERVMPNADFWQRFNEGLCEYVAIPPDMRKTSIENSNLQDADDTPFRFFARNYQRYIVVKEMPKACPKYVINKMREHGLLNEEGKLINLPQSPIPLPIPATFSYGDVPSVSSYAETLIPAPTDIGDPYASGTFDPASQYDGLGGQFGTHAPLSYFLPNITPHQLTQTPDGDNWETTQVVDQTPGIATNNYLFSPYEPMFLGTYSPATTNGGDLHTSEFDFLPNVAAQQLLPTADGGFETPHPNSAWEFPHQTAQSQDNMTSDDLSLSGFTSLPPINPAAPFDSQPGNALPYSSPPGAYPHAGTFMQYPDIHAWHASGNSASSGQVNSNRHRTPPPGNTPPTAGRSR